jgi:LmbE family N-acetylglucosaminyl deacetylase
MKTLEVEDGSLANASLLNEKKNGPRFTAERCLLAFLSASVLAMFLYLVIDSSDNDSSNNETIPLSLPVENWAGKKLMFIYGHPDDMEASAGGLVSILNEKDQNTEVYSLIMTNGDKGCGNQEICGNATSEEIADIRKQEQYNSADILNIPHENIFFLGYNDVELKMYSREEVTQQVVSIIRSVRPDIVMTWDPTPYLHMIPSEWSDFGYHPDHQYSGELTIDSIWYSKLSRLWPELGDAWRVSEVYRWAFNPDVTPSHYLDISGTPLEKKTEAFLEMESQFSDPNEIIEMMEILGKKVATTCKLPKGVSAEGFTYTLW